MCKKQSLLDQVLYCNILEETETMSHHANTGTFLFDTGIKTYICLKDCGQTCIQLFQKDIQADCCKSGNASFIAGPKGPALYFG